MARMIDLDQLLQYPIRRGSKYLDEEKANPHWLNGVEAVLEYAEELPILTQPNEWVSAKDNPPQLTGKYICCVEDTHGHMWSIPADYLLELKTWVGEFGEVKNKVVYWMPLPAPPDCRPPDGEEET